MKQHIFSGSKEDLAEQIVISSLINNNVIGSNEQVLAINLKKEGLINYVFEVKIQNRELICKYSEDSFRGIPGTANRDRVRKEYIAINTLSTLVKDKTHFPSIIFYDESNSVLAMESVSPETSSLDDLLHRGNINLSIAEELGKFIAVIHNSTVGSEDLKNEFDSMELIEKLRIPWYYNNTTDDPDLKREISKLANDLTEIKVCFIHADYKPNNILIYNNNQYVVIDFEECCYGNPILDLSTMISIYLLFGIYHQKNTVDFLKGVDSFWNNYKDNLKFRNPLELESDIVKHACIDMLARIDGKAKRDFLQREDIIVNVRQLAKEVVLGDITTLTGIYDFMSKL